MTKSRRARIAPYVLVGVIAAYLYHVATNIRYSERAGTLGPDFWPRLILALILVACLYEIVKVVFARRVSEAPGLLDALGATAAVEPEIAEEPARRHPVLLLAGIALTSVYVAAVQMLGFFTATVPYLALFILIGGYRRPGVIAAVSVLGTLLMFFFFMKVVYVSLPLGVPPFQSVTLFLMQVFGIR